MTTTTQIATLPPWEDDRRTQFLEALRRGHVDDLLHAFLGPTAVLTAPLRDLAQYLVEIRRQNVAVLGNYEAFVRHTPRGDLGQVIKGVRLSLADGTLVQIPDRRAKFVAGTDDEWQYPDDKGKRFEWRDVYNRPDQALVAYTGYLAMNAVAGCSVQQPPTVVVDGREVENPYVGRGRDGDLERIVIQCNVAGPAPLTGNVVIVQYTLDLDPRRDLQHMLSNIMRGRPNDNRDAAESGHAAVRLLPGAAFQAFADRQPEPWRWHWTPLHGGVGIAHDLAHPDVIYAYDKYIGILENCFKKAQTVARRNAMKSHPALATQKVRMVDGAATVAVTGWTGGEGVLDHYVRALERVSTRQIDAAVEIIDVSEVYDPERDATGDPELDPVAEDEAEATDPEAQERRSILGLLDELVASGDLTTREIAALGYPPSTTPALDTLVDMLDRARQIAGHEED